jgi:putative spermidine/putrescine transport system ATP-binding protein
MAQLELQHVRKQFGEFVALRGLDLAVSSGEFVSLLGPSGCGKTTALRIIAGFERASSGGVLIDGKDISSVPANRRDMGMVFQAYSLFPNMTAQQNVEFGLRVRRRSRKERAAKAIDLLKLVGLESAMQRYPHQLSGGQQQRVALARALAIEPSVLLLDEPLSALDAKVRVQLREEIRRIQRELGITTLYVTHDQEEALSVSDRVVVLSQGQIEQIGPPAEIYGNPQTAFVAAFIGTMNRIEAMVSSPQTGVVEVAANSFTIDAAREWARGKRVLVLIRPESVQIEPWSYNGRVPEGVLAGIVRAHTFLGAVTRVVLESPVGSLMADVPSVDALRMGVGEKVGVQWDPASPRLISVDGDGPAGAHAAHVQDLAVIDPV